MDWKLTKKYMIVFLILLNVMLFLANYFKDNQYRQNENDLQNLNTFLADKNITLSADLPKKFYPMPFVLMKKVNYDPNILQQIFFDSLEVEKYLDFGVTILAEQNKTLIIDNGYISFENLDIQKDFVYSKTYAKNIAKPLLKKFEKYFGKFSFEQITQLDDFINVNFTQKLNGFNNFSNFFNLRLHKNGTFQVFFSSYDKIESLSEQKKIYSSSEAIYVFAKEIKNLFLNEENINIIKVDLGYYLGNLNDDYEYIFKPYYRIYIDNFETPFFVNAYTNAFEIGVNYYYK